MYFKIRNVIQSHTQRGKKNNNEITRDLSGPHKKFIQDRGKKPAKVSV